MDIRQTKHYASYMRAMGWHVEKVGKWYAYCKKFPIIGSFVKIQRPGTDISEKLISSYLSKHRTFRTLIEPMFPITFISRSTPKTPYSPTKTIHINIKPTQETIFRSFKPAARKAVRKAEKYNLTVVESDDINTFACMKSSNFFPMSYFMKRDIAKLWRAFRPVHATILFAFPAQVITPSQQHIQAFTPIPLAGVMLLFHNKTAYYWHAFSTIKGNIKRAPTILVWEAIKLSKKRSCSVFDFEGIYDPRFPKAFKHWRGFTRFKKGFGGKEIEYPCPVKLM